MNLKQCQECGQQFESKRIDQKFCTTRCKNHFNNRVKRLLKDEICIEINKILIQNRKILKQFDGQQVELKTLQQIGFNSEYFTNVQRIESKKIIYICYDIGYIFLSDERIKIHPLKKS